jgi:hypothetical protein
MGAKLICMLWLGGTIFAASPAIALAQTDGPAPIRVESGEVVVPVWAVDWDVPVQVAGLTARDFHLFEDGKEQKIQQVLVERLHQKDFVDNFGVKETETAWTPAQRWITLVSEPFAFAHWDLDPFFYLLAYVPPDSAKGSCHGINVKVKGLAVLFFAQADYCNAPHSPSDPLYGTSLSKQMEDFAASGNQGGIPLMLQTASFYRDAKPARAYITVEFPSSAIKYHETPSGLRHEVGILEMVYRKDGTIVLRSSDINEDRGPAPGSRGYYSFSRLLMPNHHEAQMELLPGDYNLRIVLSDGTKFGRAEMPITVDSYDGKQLGVSSIAICKQFHDHKETMDNLDQSRPSTLSDFVPLISKGMEFTPAADTNFRKKGTLFAYYEVYEPLLASASATAVQTRVRIINATTGEIKSDTGLRSAADWMQPGNPVIPVSQEVKLKKLAKGSYRIEVQASDSAGRSTVWRTASFTVQ